MKWLHFGKKHFPEPGIYQVDSKLVYLLEKEDEFPLKDLPEYCNQHDLEIEKIPDCVFDSFYTFEVQEMNRYAPVWIFDHRTHCRDYRTNVYYTFHEPLLISKQQDQKTCFLLENTTLLVFTTYE